MNRSAITNLNRKSIESQQYPQYALPEEFIGTQPRAQGGWCREEKDSSAGRKGGVASPSNRNADHIDLCAMRAQALPWW
jgi:hypothetical protein